MQLCSNLASRMAEPSSCSDYNPCQDTLGGEAELMIYLKNEAVARTRARTSSRAVKQLLFHFVLLLGLCRRTLVMQMSSLVYRYHVNMGTLQIGYPGYREAKGLRVLESLQ